jgi:hypothetical protein
VSIKPYIKAACSGNLREKFARLCFMTEFEQSLAHLRKHFEDAVSASTMHRPYAERVNVLLGPRVSRAQFIAYSDLYFQHKLSHHAKGFAKERKAYRMLLNMLDERKAGRFYDCNFFQLPQELTSWKKLQNHCDAMGLKAQLTIGQTWRDKESIYPIAYAVGLESKEPGFPVKLQMHKARSALNTHPAPERTL